MADLEARLQSLGADASFPPTPPLAEAVGRRLHEQPAAARPPRSRRLVAALAAAALLVPAAAVAAIPDTREAVLEWLGLRSVEVERVPVPPRAPARAPALGERVSLAAAADRVAFAPAVPAALGAPTRVHVADDPPGGRVSLVYAPRPGLSELAPGVGALLVEFRGTDTREFLAKALGPGTTIRRVRVGDAPGAFISGAPHSVLYRDARGDVRDDTIRLAGNVLLWERDGVVLRLEADVPLAEALRIARSVP